MMINKKGNKFMACNFGTDKKIGLLTKIKYFYWKNKLFTDKKMFYWLLSVANKIIWGYIKKAHPSKKVKSTPGCGWRMVIANKKLP